MPDETPHGKIPFPEPEIIVLSYMIVPVVDPEMREEIETLLPLAYSRAYRIVKDITVPDGDGLVHHFLIALRTFWRDDD